MTLRATLTGMLLVAGAAYAGAPKPVSIEDAVTASAQVMKVDVPNRLMTLKTDSGEEFEVEVDPVVQNLPQVKVGDHVSVKYYQALSARLHKPGDPELPTASLDAERAELGQKPGVSARSIKTVTVTIASVDTGNNVVKFYGPDNVVRTVNIVTPQGQTFIKSLKADDKVVLTYTESLAISVGPAP
ncbi:MAG TPA: hypothetical protein VE046_00040 [Steroidobacteraceae bacterium]|nr:hypothetical protein [Steroidobacteraceae bacterium]